MRRGRLEIWADILKAVETERKRGAPIRPTRVRSSANLPHARFQSHLVELAMRGLLTAEPLELTPEGHTFLRQVEPVQDALTAEPSIKRPPARPGAPEP